MKASPPPGVKDAAWPRSPVDHFVLAELEARTGGRFVRASRSALVNLDRIVRIEPQPSGLHALRLTDGRTIAVSRRRTAEVRRALEA